jgi:cyanuric acid amidohydrolase
MAHPLDQGALGRALADAGAGSGGAADRLVQLFAKAEAPPDGLLLGARHTMLDDSDIQHSRMARAVVGAVLAAAAGRTRIYVSGGAEHQGPPGGGPLAAIVRAAAS